MGKRSIVHWEIPTANAEVTRKFYADLFGFEFTHSDDPEYWSFATGNVGGGLSNLSDSVKPGDILLYLESDDIDADLKQIAAAGGAVVMPTMEIPTIGWFAVFTDPTGNTLALFKAMIQS
jgi:predicted enzyme related to lactoylglutathione lyase